MLQINPQKRDRFFRYCFLIGSVASILLVMIGVICYYLYPVFPETAAALYPDVVLGSSIAIGILALLTLIPGLVVFLKPVTPFQRAVWGVVFVIIVCLGVFIYIAPLLMAGG